MTQNREAFYRGKRSELNVMLALQRLRSKGLITGFTFNDKPGIDCIIEFGNKKRMLLQIKSSAQGRQQHKRRYPDIPCIAVKKSRSETPTESELEELSQEIYSLIKGEA
jgi:hypothetical protein